MKDAVRVASSLAVGIASDPPGWKSFCISTRSRVVIIVSVIASPLTKEVGWRLERGSRRKAQGVVEAIEAHSSSLSYPL